MTEIAIVRAERVGGQYEFETCHAAEGGQCPERDTPQANRTHHHSVYPFTVEPPRGVDPETHARNSAREALLLEAERVKEPVPNEQLAGLVGLTHADIAEG